ncbi:hypothetical protein SKAU_G00025650 [Synaphobranchus kaupii]|uniref:adenosine deaminase n=1 Tax=Synaphobranchus kaupii TaxID=118154 RepID=A0A9Q1GDA2_SYNKA|nr:hypothetical protein SKAU_G00025650 [Synaphobranchus kaupii]
MILATCSYNMVLLPFLHGPQVTLLSVLLLCWAGVCGGIPDPRQRESLIQQEASRQTGGTVLLTEAEQRLSALLHKLKQQEVEGPQFPPAMHFFKALPLIQRSPVFSLLQKMPKEVEGPQFPPAMHFFKALPLIQRSPVFSLLQKMPKGAALHVHSFSLVGVDWLVKNVTYRPHCYICFTTTQSVRFLFSAKQPNPRPKCSPWVLLETLRGKVDNTTSLDTSLMQNLTLFTDDSDAAYLSQDTTWDRFEESFNVASGLISHAPVFKDYFYQGLQQFYMDNVMYLELRSGVSLTYELDGSTHDRAWCFKTYQDVTRKFVEDYPDFLGARIILSTHRAQNVSEVKAVVEEAVDLQKEFPEVMAGFDLVLLHLEVGREDRGRPLWYFREALSLPADLGVTLPYFFHAGETDWEGTDVDENLLDALIFNTTRIGHGFALTRHPLAKELSRKRGVAVEVCPISNQVLGFVSDLRNHPAAVLMSEGHPIVVSSDDPASFGATGLSYDFYEAFVGLGGMNSHLGTLKELAINSIRYSSLSPQLKDKALALWQRKWDKFISENSQ